MARIAGTEVARGSSDIILMDNNFASIVRVSMQGCCANDTTHKFLQSQISTKVTAIIMSMSAVALTEMSALVLFNSGLHFTVIPMLWPGVICFQLSNLVHLL